MAGTLMLRFIVPVLRFSPKCFHLCIISALQCIKSECTRIGDKAELQIMFKTYFNMTVNKWT